MSPEEREVFEKEAVSKKFATLRELADFLHQSTFLSYNICIVWAQIINAQHGLGLR